MGEVVERADGPVDGVQAPSTLGSFLRSFTHGHVKQLHAVARRLLPRLASCPPLLPGADQVAYVGIDDTIRRTYGYAKQCARYGYSKVKRLNALLGIASTPLAAVVGGGDPPPLRAAELSTNLRIAKFCNSLHAVLAVSASSRGHGTR